MPAAFCFHDVNTAAFTSRIPAEKLLTIGVDYVRVGDRVYNPVRMGDVLDGVVEAVQKDFGYKAGEENHRAEARWQPGRPDYRGRDVRPIWRVPETERSDRHRKRKLDVQASRRSPCRTGRRFTARALWGSIGWATGTALGIAIADRSRRTVLFTGEGSHQMTAGELGTMGRNGLKPRDFRAQQRAVT